MRKLTRQFLFVICCTACVVSAGLSANNKEMTLKAGFIFNFARYSDWEQPYQTPTAFTICSPDKEFIRVAQALLAEQFVHGLPVIIKTPDVNTSPTPECDALYITSKYHHLWKDKRIPVSPNSMLIGDNSDFIASGGHIRFFLLSGKIRFEVSPTALQSSGITMSSKVLRLGKIAKEGAK